MRNLERGANVSLSTDVRRPAGGGDDPPDGRRDAQYEKSYLLIGILVGIVGTALPLIFIVGEKFFLGEGWHVRGSISAYYHTTMRDVFVAGLCVTGFLLATYRAGEPRKPEFWASLIAGVTVLGVVFFPTGRPGLLPETLRCGPGQDLPGCSPVQQRLGEVQAAAIHFGCALVFILTLAALCFVFARHREDSWRGVQIVCGVVIIAAVAGIIAGEANDVALGELTPLYVGEVVSVWAFAVSWLVESRCSWHGLRATPNRAA